MTDPIFSAADSARLHAPAETSAPAAKLRSLLRTRFASRRADPARCWTLAAGAYDALTAALLTDLGYEAIHASGAQLAAARHMAPDIGVCPPQRMLELLAELGRGVDAARDRTWHDAGVILSAPPVFADVDAGCGGAAQAYAHSRELLRAGAAALHVVEASASRRLEKIAAVREAVRSCGGNALVVARADTPDEALSAASLGADVVRAELPEADAEAARAFAAAVHAREPELMLALDLTPALRWDSAKREGRLPSNRALGEQGYVLQFSSLLALRAAGMALEAWLGGFRRRGVDALADLQLVETASLDGEPRTRRHERFAGAGRWRAVERAAGERSLV